MRDWKLRIGVVAGLLAAAALAPVAAQGSGAGISASGSEPVATTSAESLVKYLGPKRLKIAKRIRYVGVCSADCEVTAQSTLVLPGPNLGPTSVSGFFGAGQKFESFLKLNRGALAALKRYASQAKLRTKISAFNPQTGERDVDSRVYRFFVKKKKK